MRGSLIFTGLLGGFITLLLWTGLDYPPEVQVLPLVAGIPSLALIVILVAGEFHPPTMRWMDSALDDMWGGKQQTADASGAVTSQTGWGPVLRVMTWALVFFGAVFFLGLFVVPPLFIVAYLTLEADLRFTRALLADGVACVALYGGMALLRVDLWTGAIPEVLPGLLGGGIIPPL